MNDFWAGLGVGSIFFFPLLAVAFMMHGFNFITIHKHYHNDKGE